MLIVDQGAHKIRKVDAASNNISTFAGNGSQGFSGDGGQAALATFNNPTATAVDAAGNVYVTDQSNQRIRLIDTAGTILTVAGNGNVAFSGDGGSATAASLNYPGGIVLDSSGALYIVDSVNQRVRKVRQEQLSVQAPWSLSGKNSVVVSVTTAAGNAQVTVPVLGAQPGIFILDGASSGATHSSDGSVAGASNPAARDETLVLYLTGLGPVQNTPASGDAASLSTLSPTVIKPTVTIGGFDSTVIFSGLTAAVATGTVDLTVTANGVTSNTAKIPIR